MFVFEERGAEEEQPKDGDGKMNKARLSQVNYETAQMMSSETDQQFNNLATLNVNDQWNGLMDISERNEDSENTSPVHKSDMSQKDSEGYQMLLQEIRKQNSQPIGSLVIFENEHTKNQ